MKKRKKRKKSRSALVQQILIPVLCAGLILLLVFVLLNREPQTVGMPEPVGPEGERTLVQEPEAEAEAEEIEIIEPAEAPQESAEDPGAVELLLQDGVLSVSGSGTMPRVTDRLSRWEAESVGAVVIAPGITALGDGALQGCTHMTKLAIPASVTQIGERAFDGCRSLAEITVGEGSASFRIDNGALLSADGSRLYVCPALGAAQVFPVPSGVTRIEPAAFADCRNLKELRLPDSLTAIGAEAFRGCEAMDGISIPSGVTEIGEGAFQGCPLQTIRAEGSGAFTVEDGVLYSADRTLLLACTRRARAMDFAVPEGVERIAAAAFYQVQLNTLTLPDSLREIGDEAFYGSRLNALTLPESLEKLGAGALSYCGIASLTIPAGVTEIGEGCFRGCNRLAEIPVAEGNENYRCVDGVLFSADGRLLLSCPWELKLSDYAVPEGTERIAAYAFVGFNQKGVLTIPASVSEIDENALSRCYGLSAILVDEANPAYRSADGVLFNRDQTVLLRYPAEKPEENCTIPDSVKIIAPCAFSENYALTDIRIPGGVAVIADEAFSSCAALERLTIEPGLRIIGDEAFLGCAALIDLSIPESVIRLGTRAFANCSALESLELPGSLRVIGEEVFRRNDCLRELVLPDGMPLISGGMFAWCGSLEQVSIPASVTAIGQNAFSECGSLATIKYRGSESLWNRILIDGGNTPLERAKLILDQP